MTIHPAVARRLPGILRAAEIVIGLATIGFVSYLFLNRLQPDLLNREGIFGMEPVHVAPPPRIIRVLGDRDLPIPAGEHVDTTFVVRDPRPCTLSGNVSGVLGGSRDVEVYLLDDVGNDDWHDGVMPRPLFYSGRSARISLHVPLPGKGRYHFLISNRYSIFTDKLVAVRDLHVTCATPD